MPKFRKKPLVIKAVQWFPGLHVEGVITPSEAETFAPHVITAHGQAAYLAPGDWVIAEPDGVHHYPCKPDIFAATYDRVED